MPRLPHSSAFIGRERELAVLSQRLAQTAADEGGVALVVGEPGIGKTRLLIELAEHARRDGWAILLGRAYDTEGMPPYLPFVEALRVFVRDSSPERLSAQLGRGAAEVALLLPELRDLLPDLPASVPLSPEQERYRLFEAVCDVLDAIARGGETGLLLLLDDLHWADSPSLWLLQHLARRLAGVPTLVVAMHRTTEVEPSKAFTDTLAALAREGVPAPLTLAALGLDDTAALAGSIVGGQVALPIVAAIQRATEGNPFFVSEVVRSLQAEGRDLSDPVAAGGDFAVPELVRQVIAARLGRLHPPTIELLRQGAVLGDGFRFEVARTASRLDEEIATEAIEEALAAGMLRPEGDTYHFAHALIRRTIYDALSVPRRQRLHFHAAEVIEATYARNLGPHVRELVTHYRLAGSAGEPERMIDLYRRAGEAAAAVFAWEEAATLWEDALGLLPADRPAERIELLLALGDAYTSAGDRRSGDAFQQAAALAREAHAPEWLARAALGLGGAGYVPAATDQSVIELLQEALSAVSPDDSVTRARLLARLALELRQDELRARSTALSREAEAMARRVGDVHSLGLALLAKGIALRRWEDLDKQIAAATALATLARETGDRERTLWANDMIVFTYLRRGDVERVDAALAESTRIAEELRHSHFLWWTTAYRAMQAMLAGDLTVSEQLAAQALALAQPTQRDAALRGATYLWQIAALRREQGRAVEVLADTTRVAEQSPHLAWQGLLSILYCELGRHAEAARILGVIMAQDLAGLDLQSPSQSLGLLAETCHALADQQHALTLYTLLSGEARHVVPVPLPQCVCQGSVSRHLGLLATTLGRWDDAGRHFEDALAMHTRMGAPVLLAHTRRQYAAMLLTRGGDGAVEQARSLLDAALATYDEVGMPTYAAVARNLLGTTPPAQASPRPVFPDGLTSREAEVLGLLAGGLSNREIAETLVVSVRTVGRHVDNVYGKIGVHERSKARQYARDHGLTAPPSSSGA